MGAGAKAQMILEVLEIGETVTASQIKKRLEEKYNERIHAGGIGSLIRWYLDGKYVRISSRETDKAMRYTRVR